MDITVTSATRVMVGVFSIFGTLTELDVKLLGKWNWYLPSWLECLPHTSHERRPAHAAVSAARAR